MNRQGKRLIAVAIAAAALASAPAWAAVGDIVKQHTAPVSGVDTYCSIGLAFDGASLYYDRCGDTNIYRVDPNTGALTDTFDTGLTGKYPNALAFDKTRNGLWIGAQACDFEVTGAPLGMPIYFWDFDDNSVTLQFHIATDLINPATGQGFLGFCFTDGLAFNAGDEADPSDDELWFSDDVNHNLGVFRPDGTLVKGYDSTTVDASMSEQSGLAVGGPLLYLGNDGGAQVFRALIATDPLVSDGLFVSGDGRQEDMECDPVTFAPTEVMWVRTTPQGGAFPDHITAYEIEPNSCGLGGGQDCGNGVLEGSEECDDGNHDPGDGCSPTCTIEEPSCDCVDADGDGYKVPTPGCEGADHVIIDPVCGPFDCDDSDPAIHPYGAEIPGNGVDENCNDSLVCGALGGAGATPWSALALLAPAALLFVRRRLL